MNELRVNEEKLKIYSSKLDACVREFSASFSNFSFNLPNSSEFSSLITSNNDINNQIKVICDNYSKQNKLLSQYIKEFENVEKSLINNINISNIQEVQSLIKALPKIQVDDISFNISVKLIVTPQQEQAKKAGIASGMKMAREAAAAAAAAAASSSNGSNNESQEKTYEDFGELSKDMLENIVDNNGNINCSAEEFADQLLACGIDMGMTSEELIEEIEVWNAEARNIRDQIKNGNYESQEELNQLKQTLNTIGGISSAYQQNYGKVNTYEGQQQATTYEFASFASNNLTVAGANEYRDYISDKITTITENTQQEDNSKLEQAFGNHRIDLYKMCDEVVVDNMKSIAELDGWKSGITAEYTNFVNNVSSNEDFDNYLDRLSTEINEIEPGYEAFKAEKQAKKESYTLDEIINVNIEEQKLGILKGVTQQIGSVYEMVKNSEPTTVTVQTGATIDPEVTAYNAYCNEIDSQIVESEASIKNMESMLDNPYLPTESKNQIIENINNEKAKINELEARKNESVYVTEQQLEQYRENYGSYLTMDPYAPGMPSDVSEIILNYQSMEKQYEYQHNITLKNATVENANANLDAAKKELESAKNIVTSVPGMPSSVTSILENQKQEKINAATDKVNELQIQVDNSIKELNNEITQILTKADVGEDITTQTIATLAPEVVEYNEYCDNINKEIAEKESSIEKMEGMLDNPHLPTESRNQIIENINNEKNDINILEAKKNESVYMSEKEYEKYKPYLTMKTNVPGMPSDVSETISNQQKKAQQLEIQNDLILKSVVAENANSDLDAAKKELEAANDIVTSFPGMPSNVISILESQKQEKIDAATDKVNELQTQVDNATKELNKSVNRNLINYADNLDLQKQDLISKNIELESIKQYVPTSEIDKINQTISDNNQKYSDLTAAQEAYYEMAELDLTNNDNLSKLVDSYNNPNTKEEEIKYGIFFSAYEQVVSSELAAEKQLLSDYEQQKTATYLPTSELNKINNLIDEQKKTVEELSQIWDENFNVEKMFEKYVENTNKLNSDTNANLDRIREENRILEIQANALGYSYEAQLEILRKQQEEEANKNFFEKTWDNWYNFGADLALSNAENKMQHENGEIATFEYTVNSVFNIGGEAAKTAAATFGHAAISVWTGFENGAEALIDFGVTSVIGLYSVIPFLCDAVTGKLGTKDSETQKLYDRKDEFVATDWIGNAEDAFYETKIGKMIENNSLITRGGEVDNFLKGMGEVFFVVAFGKLKTSAGTNAGINAGKKEATKVLTKGGSVEAAKLAGNTAAATTSFAINSIPVATMKGFGSANERALLDGATSVEAGIYGLVSGGWEGIQWSAGIGINKLTLSSLTNATTFGGKTTVFGLSVAADAVDSGIEGFVQPGLQMIYKDGTYGEIFKANGGWDTVLAQTIMGGTMSAFGTIDDFSRSFKNSNVNNPGVSYEPSKVEANRTEIENTYKQYYSGEITAADFDAKITDILGEHSNKAGNGRMEFDLDTTAPLPKIDIEEAEVTPKFDLDTTAPLPKIDIEEAEVTPKFDLDATATAPLPKVDIEESGTKIELDTEATATAPLPKNDNYMDIKKEIDLAVERKVEEFFDNEAVKNMIEDMKLTTDAYNKAVEMVKKYEQRVMEVDYINSLTPEQKINYITKKVNESIKPENKPYIDKIQAAFESNSTPDSLNLVKQAVNYILEINPEGGKKFVDSLIYLRRGYNFSFDTISLLGTSHQDYNKIALSGATINSNTIETVIHEITHAMDNFIAGYKRPVQFDSVIKKAHEQMESNMSFKNPLIDNANACDVFKQYVLMDVDGKFAEYIENNNIYYASLVEEEVYNLKALFEANNEYYNYPVLTGENLIKMQTILDNNPIAKQYFEQLEIPLNEYTLRTIELDGFENIKLDFNKINASLKLEYMLSFDDIFRSNSYLEEFASGIAGGNDVFFEKYGLDLYGHSDLYYRIDDDNVYAEAIADFNTLKLMNDTKSLEQFKLMYGEEYYNLLNKRADYYLDFLSDGTKMAGW